MMIKDEIEQIFRCNYRSMLILANRFLHDEDAARDIVQDVFTSLLDDNISSANSTYLLNAVRFACLKHIRSLSVSERIKKLYSLELEETETVKLTDEHNIAKLNNIIETQLPEKSRRVLKLKFINHLTYKEISDELSVSEVTVYKHLRQAITILRKYFNDNER